MEEIKDQEMGLIYLITNKINGKIYIGKTKEYYGKKNKFGINGRFNKHIKTALSNNKNKNDCPRLYGAIRKYGKDNFKVEELLKCPISEYDEKEIEMIRLYDSTNRKIGYNIAQGGLGRSVVNVSETSRQKISNSQCLNTSDNLMNIRPYCKKGVLIGYCVQRKEQGNQNRKWFTSTENSPEENLELAKKWLNDLKAGNLKNNPYNKPNDLPTNIAYVKKNCIIIGYQVCIISDGIRYSKRIQDKTLTMEEKFKKALDYKKSILDESKNYYNYSGN